MNHHELFESLEARVVLSAGFAWSAQEVYLLELVNRARANPMAEQARYESFVQANPNIFEGLTLDLTANLPANATADRLVPMEPLVLNPNLTLAARGHNNDMAARAFFAHVNPSGDDANARAQAAGYQGSAGENIAAGYENTEIAHIAWLVSAGHRANVLSMYSFFTETYHYNEIGLAVALPGEVGPSDAPFQSYYTQKFGIPTNSKPYITGVAFRDMDGDQFYTPGEGVAGIRIIVAPANQPGNIISAYTTDSVGYYAIALPGGGNYSVTILNTSTGAYLNRTVTVDANYNLKLDINPDDLGAYQPGDSGGIPGGWGSGGSGGGLPGGGGGGIPGGGGSGGGGGGEDGGGEGGGGSTPLTPGQLADQFITIFKSVAPTGLADGDSVRDTLISMVPDLAFSRADWTAENFWFQDSEGSVWSLWHGGLVHLKDNGEHRWVLTNLAEAGGLVGSISFAPGSMSGVIAAWRAFSIQGISNGQLVSLWWSPESGNQGWGNNGNGWVLTPFASGVLNDHVTGLPISPPSFRPFTETQSNGQTTFDPRPSRETQNGGMSVVLVSNSGSVFVATFTTVYQSIPGARPDLRAKWLLEPLAEVPSVAHLGLSGQLAEIEQGYRTRAGIQ